MLIITLLYRSSYLVTYIIPSVLIAVMVLLSLIIACLLSRKKKVPGEGNEIRKAGGGVPVIFQDELEADHPLLHCKPFDDFWYFSLYKSLEST